MIGIGCHSPTSMGSCCPVGTAWIFADRTCSSCPRIRDKSSSNCPAGGSEEICNTADMYPVSGMGKGKNRIPCQVKGKDDGKRREQVKGEEKGKGRGRKEGQAKGKDKGKEQTKGKEKGMTMRQERAKGKDKGKRQEQEKGKVNGRGKDLPRAYGVVASGLEHRIGKGKGKETNAGEASYKSKGAGKGKGTVGSKPETSHAEARLGSATDVEPSGSRGSLPEAEATCCSEEEPQLLRQVAGIVQEPIAAMTDGKPKTPRTLSANPEPPSPVSTTATADLAWVASPDSGSLSCFSAASVCASPEPGSTKAALQDLESQEHWPSLAQGRTRKAVQDSCLPLQLSAEAGWPASLAQALRLRDPRERPTSETEPKGPSSTFASNAERNSEQKESCSSKAGAPEGETIRNCKKNPAESNRQVQESTLAKSRGDAS